jgi:glucan biosynthesis protein
MARAPQPLSRILAADPTVAGWQARRRREEALAGIVRRHLPRPLADRVRVVDAEGGELELAVDAGAIAAVVRQRTPDLLAALLREHWQFTGIRVRVQVRVDPVPRQKIDVNQPDRDSLRPLADLARRLPPGPLKASLARLLRRLG